MCGEEGRTSLTLCLSHHALRPALGSSRPRSKTEVSLSDLK